MADKKIKDIKISVVNGKTLKTTWFTDGSKQVAIVPDRATDTLIKVLDGMPDLKVMTGFKKDRQTGNISYALAVALATVAIWFCGCVEDDDRCVRPNWHSYDDCWGEP